MKPNIVFLDFDGVICNPGTCIAMGDVGGCFSYIDPVSAHLVKRLCDETNSKIVISSSWRLLYDQWAIRAILGAVVPKLGDYIWHSSEEWCTPNLGTERGIEIKSWVDKHSSEFNRFVILDDNSDMESVEGSFVQTDAYEGFGYKHFKQAVKILKDCK